jgi:FkbM family methyltransferase
MINCAFVSEVGMRRWAWRTFLRQCSKRALRRDNTLILPTGLLIHLPRDSQFGSEVFVTNANVDWGSEAVFVNNLESTGAVLDIGANIGYYSLYVLPRVFAVYAFEPDARAQKALGRNLRDHPNAHIQRLAVGRFNGKAKFVFARRSEISHLSNDSTKGQEIEIVTIDRFVTDYKLWVTGIKIDAEGADVDVVEGAIATLESQSPLVLTEAKPEDRLFAIIGPLDYRVFAFIRDLRNLKQPYFAEITRGDSRQTKMLFLTPKRLQQKFEALAP